MLIKIFLALSSISPNLKKLLWKQWYQLLASHYQTKDWSFMNYGYAALDDHSETLKLNEADEPDRYAIQLYHHVISAVDLADLDVLEVGSGRGGGASYIARYLKPKTLTGLDVSDRAIQFCKHVHAVGGLSFTKGDAESLPFDAASFDAVINIESSHCYGSMEAFLANAKRVLRQNGYFIYADFRNKNDVALLHSLMEQSGMKILKREDITANVLRSLDLDDRRKVLLIRTLFRNWLLKPFLEFAGVKGSKIYSGFESGAIAYLHYLLQK
ncbi:MAG TPA: class I SAM-dependent methyltransferase [Candidatus Binatia bacterium]|nr:class I SAM-dependent methyltransferase [Candidatus Binatia bacterium]